MRNAFLYFGCLFLFACSSVPSAPEVPVLPTPVPTPQQRPATPREYDKEVDLAEAMRQAIRRNLVVPPGDFSVATEAIIDLVVFADGAVLEVQISKSTGDEKLDRAIVRAVRVSQPLPVLKDPAVTTKSKRYRLVFHPIAPAVK